MSRPAAPVTTKSTHMKTIDLIQGSPEWAAHRAQHWNASDAPAMMGCSPYTTRNELLHRLHTGISPDVDAGTQRRFDDGHRFEALARPLAEAIIGQELYPVTGTNGRLSASFDGITLLECTAFEHKSLNASLRYTPWDEGSGDHLPLHYRVQMEHQLIVSGAKCVLFMATKWDGDTLLERRHCWYSSDPKLRAQILAGWDQFAADLAVYAHTPAEVKPTGKAPDALPALRIEVTGAVTASNLAEFKAQALAVFQGISRDLQTDADFSDAEATVKWAKGIEDRLASAKESALAQTESIDLLFRAIDDISAEARRVRLDLTNLVKARKEAIKTEIVEAGIAALAAHIREQHAALPDTVSIPQVPANFGGCIKGLKSVDSIKNAVNSEIARAKIAVNDWVTRIHINLATIKASGLSLPDHGALALKAPDDLAAILAQRAAAEKAKEDAQRERIREEEIARLAAEHKAAEQTAQAMQRAAAPPPATPATPAPQAAPAAPVQTPIFSAPVAAPATADTGARLTLGQINERLAPLSISVAGLSQLGFDPVEQVKASRLYRASDLPAIGQAAACHAIAATAGVAA